MDNLKLNIRLTKAQLLINWSKIRDIIKDSSSKIFHIFIEGGSDKRTLEQNNYYFGVLVNAFIKEGLGSKYEVHKILKEKFLDTDTTTTLTKEQFATYIDQCTGLLFEIGGSLTQRQKDLAIKAGVDEKILAVCSCCLKNRATQRHHKFSQTDTNLKKYGRKLIEDPKNIQLVCADCHASHASPKLIHWNEREFREALDIND